MEARVDRQQLEAVFLGNLDTIERIGASICRRHGVRGDDAVDFASWIKLKLVEDEYAVFRKFRNESGIGTYLTVVIAMLFRDYRVHRWGRWRPSAAARRRGGIAVRLEMLVYRQAYRFNEAAEVLRSSGETSLSDRELAKLLAELPARSLPRPREVGPEPLAVTAAADEADDLILASVAESERQAMQNALSRALERLEPEDRLIVRMRFWEGLTVAAISRALQLEQKALYRRLERALAELREHLERSGVSRDHAQVVLNELSS
jgi:RNA polymerase sigma factor (sigma-70 family)